VSAGLLLPPAGKRRGIRLLASQPKDGTMLPFLGYIAAGHPIEAVPQDETIVVPSEFCGSGRCYCLRVRGDSMVEDGILDGDWVVVEHRSHARNGEIVVALVDGVEATLKRILQTPNSVTLTPANSRLNPLVYRPERVEIQGAVVAQMRRYL
jgi:repressor LexA